MMPSLRQSRDRVSNLKTLPHLMANHRFRQLFELLYLLVLKDLKVRYKNSVLGYLWAIANPFAFAFVYWVAFKFIMRVQMENYSIFLISGLFPWLWLSNGITQATRSYQNNSSLIKRVNLNRAVLPLSNIIQEMAHFMFALPVIVIFLALNGGHAFYWSWLWQLPLMMMLQLAFIYPVALIFAVANVYVRDIEYLVGIGFSLLFFATPMVYPIEQVPEAFRGYFALNPLHALIASWRAIFLHGQIEPGLWGYFSLWIALLTVLGFFFYRRMSGRIGELL